ncbi:MAG: hypothetical protein EA398_15145 [Deltaproteobacteria bacterium]|nr:MAG: hypothetical protein EA398_15145 [Deltaproteobacteria bacterium]
MRRLLLSLLAAGAVAVGGCLPLIGEAGRDDPAPATRTSARLWLDLQVAELDETLPELTRHLLLALERASGQTATELLLARERLLADLLLLPEPRPAAAQASLDLLLPGRADDPSPALATALLATGIEDPRSRVALSVLAEGPAALWSDDVAPRWRHVPEVRIAALAHALPRLDVAAAAEHCSGTLLWMAELVDEELGRTLCSCAPDTCLNTLGLLADAHAPAGSEHWASAEILWLHAVDTVRRHALRDAAADVRVARWWTPGLGAVGSGLLDVRVDEPLPRSLWRTDLRLDPPVLPPLAAGAPAHILPRSHARRTLVVRSDGLALTLRPVVVFDPDATALAGRWTLLAGDGPWAAPGLDVLAFAGLAAPLAGHVEDDVLPTLVEHVERMDEGVPERFAGSPRMAVLADSDTQAGTLATLHRTLASTGVSTLHWLAIDPADGRARTLPFRATLDPPEQGLVIRVRLRGVRVVGVEEVEPEPPPGTGDEEGDADRDSAADAADEPDALPIEAQAAAVGDVYIRWADPAFFARLGDAVTRGLASGPRPIILQVDDPLTEWSLLVKVALSAGWAWPHDEPLHPWRATDGEWPAARGGGVVWIAWPGLGEAAAP